MTSRLAGFACLACLFIPWSAFFASLHFDATVWKMDDSAQYLLLAKSLSRGLGFSNLAMPGVPDFLNLPSALPVFLIPYWWLESPPQSALLLGMAMASCLGAWLSFLWLARFLPRHQAFLIALAFASSPLFVYLSSSIMTESPYVLFLYAGLWLSVRDAESGGKGSEGWLALLCWLILFRLRINTMPFLAVHLLMLMRRGEKAKWMAGSFLALAWLAFEWTQHRPEGGGYLRHDLGKRFALDSGPLDSAMVLVQATAANLYSFFGSAFAQLMVPYLYGLHPMDPLKRMAVLGLSAWALWGLWIFWKRYPAVRPFLVAFLLSWAPFFLQRSVALTRYMYPSFPVLAACLVLPFHVLQARFAGRAIPALAAASLLLLMANQVLQTSRVPEFRDIGEERRSFHHMHAFIRSYHPPPDVVVSHYHFHAHIETGRPALRYPDQWSYAVSRRMFAGRERIWILLPSKPEESGLWDLGAGWSLGRSPLAVKGHLSLYEVLPSGAEAARTARP